jgi:hypothetical protein
MSTVYRCSAVTLAATMASNASEGFLHACERPDPWIPWKDSKSGILGKAHLRPKNQRWIDLLGFETPLLERGWTLQERLLAPRVIHFGRQMFWECWGCMCTQDQNLQERTEELTRTSASGEERRKDSSNGLGYLNRHRRRRKPLPPLEKNFNLFKYWSQVLSDFSDRKLTVPSDKLPALAGMAQIVQQQTRDEYYAGLWRSCLAPSLLWKRNDEKYLIRASQYRAPSWSWASCDGRIERWRHSNWLTSSKNQQTHSEHNSIEILDISVDYLPKNSLGRVKSGYVKLCGPIARLEELDEDRSYDIPDAEIMEILDDRLPISIMQTRDSPRSNSWACWFDCETDTLSKRLWLLLVHTYITSESDGSNLILLGMRHGAVILEELEKSDPGGKMVTYQRLGIASRTVGTDLITERQGVTGEAHIFMDDPWETHSIKWNLASLTII